MKILKSIILLPLIMVVLMTTSSAQEVTLALNYKHKRIDATGNVPYTKALILLHPMYNGVDLANNYVVGHLVARRGAITSSNRLNTVFINSSSAYRTASASLSSHDDKTSLWKLKTCFYNGVKYLAIDIPYEPQQHSAGFQFAGWYTSTGESLKFVIYDINGVSHNTETLTTIQDYVPNIDNTLHLRNFNVLGKVGIGTTTPKEELSVNGDIRAHEIKVETSNWPDYVFRKNYRLLSLTEIEKYIKAHGHLPEMPSAAAVEANGVSLGETNAALLKKVEELTLHLIEKDKLLESVLRRVEKLESKQ